MSEHKDEFHVHIDAAKKRADIPEYDQTLRCTCGGETDTGFGLAGGGYGIYSFCLFCSAIVSKSETPE